MLVADPHPCWLVRVRDQHVFLPLDWDDPERAPLKERYISNHAGQDVALRIVEHWPFQAFGTLTTVPVHLAGAHHVDSLVGFTVRGSLPNGDPLRGVCIRHDDGSAARPSAIGLGPSQSGGVRLARHLSHTPHGGHPEM